MVESLLESFLVIFLVQVASMTVEPRSTNASHHKSVHKQIFQTKKVSGDEQCLE
jgi:hypothetical protein